MQCYCRHTLRLTMSVSTVSKAKRSRCLRHRSKPEGAFMLASVIRDYSLTGPEAQRAAERGLTKAVWYRSPLARERIKELMKRNDFPALPQLFVWLALLVVSGSGAYLTLGTPWCVPFFFIYGILYGSCSDSRWHEFGHGTAFRTRWIND